MQEFEESKPNPGIGFGNIYAYDIPRYSYSRSAKKYSAYLASKRACDLVLSFCALVVFSPLMLIISILIKATSRGPVIFSQERLGLYGKSFNIYKFRSMRLDAEKNGPKWADKDDNRVTPVGRLLRKLHLDELPQVVNILRGEMSLVGPRPEREYFYNKFESYIPDFRVRLSVKPGLTGWAQINGGYDIGPAKKLRYDKEYISKCSIKMDLLVLFKTVNIVFRCSGAR
jgi:exopolysaccharide biosynthesis polyprenyl glycosylphosphotransferase